MKSKVTIIVLFVAILFAACKVKVGTTPEQTKMEQTLKNLSFPMETGFAKEYLQTNFWKCNYNSAGDSLAYWIVLPNNVKPVHIEPTFIDSATLLNIGR